MGRVVLTIILAALVATSSFSVALAKPAAAQPPQMVKVLISFDRQPGPDEEAIVRGASGTIKYTYHLVPAIAASIPEAAIEGLRKNHRVT